MTPVARIAAVEMGRRETKAVIRWYDADTADGFPPLIVEEEHSWAGRLHHREIAIMVADLRGPR